MSKRPSVIVTSRDISPTMLTAQQSSPAIGEIKKVAPEESDETFAQYHFYSNPNSLSPSLLEAEKIADPYSCVGPDEILVEPRNRAKLQKVVPKRPYFLMIVTIIQCLVLIAEIVVNYKLTGNVIETTPSFNYLIGPGVGTLIQMGGRVVPCMKGNTGYDSADSVILCPSTGIKIAGSVIVNGVNQTTCLLTDICGMGGIVGTPSQWWRFIVPIFLHGGVLHLFFNMVFQVKTGFPLEIDIGSLRMSLIYMITGIGSMVFSGIFTGTLSPTTGCSGALYACTILDLIQNWKLSPSPWKDLSLLVGEVVILLFIGTLPFLDNYAHFGGFGLGVLCGFVFIPSLNFSAFDKYKKRVLMAVALPMLLALFIFLFVAFYKLNVGQICTFCKYLNCIPGMPWCTDKWATSRIGSS